MLTPNDIRNVVFTKGMGGYKTSEVDVSSTSVPIRWKR